MTSMARDADGGKAPSAHSRAASSPGVGRSEPRTAAEPHSLALLQPIWELNARCLRLLAEDAGTSPADSFPLVRHIRDALLTQSSETQTRAARTSFLLLDLEFSNLNWWQTVVTRPSHSPALPAWRGRFSRAGGRTLARGALSVAWHALRADPRAHCRFGVLPAVGAVLESLSLAQVERLGERHYRFLRPRWEDRPDVWRQLLEGAATADYRRTRDFNIRGLQLLLGVLLGG
jgi:hypothetical protein